MLEVSLSAGGGVEGGGAVLEAAATEGLAQDGIRGELLLLLGCLDEGLVVAWGAELQKVTRRFEDCKGIK